jgi:hypothetical protein
VAAALDWAVGKILPSVTIKLPAPLDKKLRVEAKRRGASLSLLARQALDREILTGLVSVSGKEKKLA